jgi:hypothetical protein
LAFHFFLPFSQRKMKIPVRNYPPLLGPPSGPAFPRRSSHRSGCG